MSRKLKTESPIKENPLPSAGHFLQVKVFYKIIILLTAVFVPSSAILGIFAGKLVERYFSFEISLKLLAEIWGISMGMVYLFMKKIEPQMNCWLQGRDGEVFVAEYFDGLKEFGCKVLHDFVEKGSAWNIDHLVIAPQGVFTIETKTPSKISRNRDEHIVYDGNIVRRESGLFIENPLEQAEAEAKQIFNFIEKHLSLRLAVQPIVVYPAWWVDGTNWSNMDSHKIWVCNHKFIKDLICSRPRKLSGEEVQRIYTCLADYSRNRNE